MNIKVVGKNIMNLLFNEYGVESGDYYTFWVRRKITQRLYGIYIYDGIAYFTDNGTIIDIVPAKLSALSVAMIPKYCKNYMEIMALKNHDNTVKMRELL